MGELLAFPLRKSTRRQQREPAAFGEIVLFTGVRYIRMDEPAERPKRPSRRSPRRRERTETEKVS